MRAFGLTLLLACLSGCTDDNAVPGNGETEKKPETVVQDPKPGAQAAEAKPVQKVAEASYNIEVTSRSGASLCLGDAKIEISSDFAMKFPSAKLNCVSLTIDLGKLLGATQSSNANAKLSSDGKILYMDKFGSATFTPPRPFLVGPIVQNPDDFEGLKQEDDYSVSYSTATGSDTKSGKIKVKVIETEGSFSSKNFDKKLNKVLHWQMTTTGFDKVPVASTFLFDKIEFYWNTRPIMVPKIIIEGFLGDFVNMSSGDGKASVNIDDLVGKIRLELTATEFETF